MIDERELLTIQHIIEHISYITSSNVRCLMGISDFIYNKRHQSMCKKDVLTFY